MSIKKGLGFYAKSLIFLLVFVVFRAGFEPATNGLKVQDQNGKRNIGENQGIFYIVI